MLLPMSASAATTVPITDLFSSILKDSDELKIGELSFKLFTLTVMSWVTGVGPSVTVTVAVNEVLVS